MSYFISICALLFSIYNFGRTNSKNQTKSQYTELSSTYRDNLLKEIPIAFDNLDFTKSNSGVDEFLDSIRRTMNSIRVIKLVDKISYDRLYGKLIKIENEVVHYSNFKEPDNEHQIRFKKEILDHLNEFYTMILSDDYKGKKFLRF